MAPIKHLLTARISHSSHGSHSSGGGGAPIGGGVVAAIIGFMILIFIIAFVYQYRKGYYPFPYIISNTLTYNSVPDPSRNQYTHSNRKDFQECHTYCYIFWPDRSLLCRVFGEYRRSCCRDWWRRTGTTNGYAEWRRIRAAFANAKLYPTDGFHSHLECSCVSHPGVIQGGSMRKSALEF
jgi:hypothetical protein